MARVRLNTLVPRVSPDDYRNNLQRIVELVRSNGADVMFMLLTDNPIKVKYLREGLESMKNSQLDQAVKYFENGANSGGPWSDWFKHLARLQLARAYEKLGKTEEREKTLRVKPFISLHGGFPIRFDLNTTRS